MLRRFGSESPSILEAADTVSVFISHLKIESLIFLLYSDRAPMIFQQEVQDQIKWWIMHAWIIYLSRWTATWFSTQVQKVPVISLTKYKRTWGKYASPLNSSCNNVCFFPLRIHLIVWHCWPTSYLSSVVGQKCFITAPAKDVKYSFLPSLLSTQSLDNAETLGNGAVHGWTQWSLWDHQLILWSVSLNLKHNWCQWVSGSTQAIPLGHYGFLLLFITNI